MIICIFVQKGIGCLNKFNVCFFEHSIVPFAQRIILSAPDSDRAASAEELHKIIQCNGLAKEQDILIVPKLAEAIIKAKALAGEKDLILVTGSLYTVGEIMSNLGIKPFQAEVKKAVPK